MRNLIGRIRRPSSRSLVENVLSLTNAGDGSTLSLDFTSMGGLDSRVTLTRSSTTSTFINSSGLVDSAGTNVPRFDYNPTTLLFRGLLIEGAATNRAYYSEDLSQSAWTKTSVSASTASGTAPDSSQSNTANLLAENTTSNAKHAAEQSITVSAGNVYTFSVWLKEPTSNSRRYACVQLADGQAVAARYTIVVDLQTGTVTANGSTNGTAGAPTSTGHSIVGYPNGWYRVSITMNHVSSPSYPVIALSDVSTLPGNASNQPFYSATTPYKGLLVWGAQFEASTRPSSYVFSGASQGQRSADACTLTGTGFSSWFNSTEGTFFVESELSYLGSGYTRLLNFGSNINNQTTPNSISLGLDGASSNLFLNVTENSTNRGDAFIPAAGAISQTTPFKVSACYKQGDYRISRAGVSSTLTYSATYPSGLGTLGFVGTNGAYFIQTWIKKLIYYPSRLTNAQMDLWSA